jgi:hypothetical protein
MGIEYLAGIKPGDKIDLSRFGDSAGKFGKTGKFEKSIKSPESYLPELKVQLETLAQRLNAEYGDLLEDNGQIKMIGDEVEADRINIANKEKIWSEDVKKTLEETALDREKNPANIAEIAVTLLFDKVLRDEFVVMRASVYDDYENGADQLIIDKQTGAVICGFDDAVLGSFDKDQEIKKNKIDAKMKHGGARIKYGATVKEGKLERKNLENIPIFYFNLNKAELSSLLKPLTANEAELAEVEKSTYMGLVSSLSAQAEQYGSNQTLYPELRNNLRNFMPSLEKMRAKI